jgi:hypothetical protein
MTDETSYVSPTREPIYVTREEFHTITRLAVDANAEDEASGHPQGSAILTEDELERRPAAQRYIDHMISVHGCVEGRDYEVIVR